MKNKYVQMILCIVGLLILVIISSLATYKYHQKGVIAIFNKSNQSIDNVYVIYRVNGVDKKSWIGKISEHGSYHYRINYDNIYEGSISIAYFDKNIELPEYIASYDKRHYRVEIQ